MDTSPGVAPSPTKDSAELERLQRMYGDAWRIWRTPRYWMANALQDGVEPTLMEESAKALEAKMRVPGPRVGGPYTVEAT
ncbi:hypothetical protein Q7689_00430 [Nocardiopsis tropica]|uniref:hypothetical protein n=1 Tax=Nocardiopsis tropica TaxID=109330 RepID=UPI002E8683C8|nr:hypothetical protein [Nocardiopsis tropica]